MAFPKASSESALASLARFALSHEGASGEWQVGVLMTSDADIQSMHREFMDLDSPTDIMTFPYDENDPFTPTELRTSGGDIVISVETAESNARDAGWDLGRELEFLLLHGLLHLLNWDDETPEQRVAMLGRQQVILDDWHDNAG